jgi:hypothetical protein
MIMITLVNALAYGMFLAGAALSMWGLAVLSWRRPERFDASWAWTRPAPHLSALPLGPWQQHGRAAVSDEIRYLISPREDGSWHAEPAGAGATIDWSPMAEHAAADERRLPLDDVDEWLAGRLAQYRRSLIAIEVAPRGADGRPSEFGWTVDEEFDAFQRGSMGLHEYRDMILTATGGYGPREAMQLEALLAAA